MKISRIDHLVLTVQDIQQTCEFYAKVLGMEVIIESGIVPRTGAMGAIASLYIRDPDGNLVEIANY